MNHARLDSMILKIRNRINLRVAKLQAKAEKAAYAYAAEQGLSIDQVGVRASIFGTVKPFTIKEIDSNG